MFNLYHLIKNNKIIKALNALLDKNKNLKTSSNKEIKEFNIGQPIIVNKIL
jgi:hypothetical protein